MLKSKLINVSVLDRENMLGLLLLLALYNSPASTLEMKITEARTQYLSPEKRLRRSNPTDSDSVERVMTIRNFTKNQIM